MHVPNFIHSVESEICYIVHKLENLEETQRIEHRVVTLV